MAIKCYACASGKHTNPGSESPVCECGQRTCACYGFQVRAGIRTDRSVAATPKPVAEEEKP